MPTVHEKLLGALEVKDIFGDEPLHTVAVAAVVTKGVGFTVTVSVKVVPTHKPVVEVGVITYSTEPAVSLLGLVSV